MKRMKRTKRMMTTMRIEDPDPEDSEEDDNGEDDEEDGEEDDEEEGDVGSS